MVKVRQVEEELALVSPRGDTLLTIGVFDGVHFGHKYLISGLKEQAQKRHLLTGVVTFRQHPQEVLSPGTKLPYLTTLEQRVSLLYGEGVDVVVALSFTHELARLEATEFAALLQKHLRMRGLIVGPDFALGRNRGGDVARLRSLGQAQGFSVDMVLPLVVNGEVVSSTTIRKALAEGNLEKVRHLLGRDFSLEASVVSGEGHGAGGIPTANMDIDSSWALPADGVYATWAHAGGKRYPSVTNIGLRPTYSGKHRTVEVYIMDYNENLRGQALKIDVVKRLRGEKRFASAEELAEQVRKDVSLGRSVLNDRGGSG